MTSGQLHIHSNGANNLEMANTNQDESRGGRNQARPNLDTAHETKQLLGKGNKTKKTVVVIGVVVALVALVALVVVLRRGDDYSPSRRTASLSPYLPSASQPSSTSSIALESFIRGELAPNRFNGTWVSDSEILYRAKDGSIMLYNAKRRMSQLLLKGDAQVLESVISYELSADRRYLMLAHGYQKLYRHTYLAYYHIVDLETKRDWPVTDINGSQILVQLVVWSPVGNGFTYVYLNDIYYRPSVREQPIQEYRLTHTGRPGNIYNGVPDWVYEEEILGSNSALWFSPDGQYLAYATFNDSRTPVMNIPYYGAPGDVRYQYTQSVNIRYPKPGRANPTVSLSVISLGDLPYQKPIRQLEIPPRPDLKEPVLYLVAWASPSQLLVVWMNRVQNKADVVLCSTGNTNCRLVLSGEEKSGWVTVTEPLFTKDGTKMAVIHPQEQDGDAGDYRHLTFVDLASPTSRPVPLTKGKFVVTEILTWDEDNHFIYFLSNTEGAPGELRVNRVPDTTLGAPHTPECVSCLGQSEETKCLYAGATFSKNNSFFTQTCAGPDIPQVAIFNTKGEKVTVWENNDKLRNRLKNKSLPTIEQFTVPVGDGMDAQVKLILPPNLDTSGKTKYPLLVHVYGGPDTNQISERFNMGWHTYLAGNKSIIYAMIDGRGSGLKGNKMMFATYRHLGTLEVQDQINVTRYIQTHKNYVDKERTAIWGWSYGGYASGMALAKDTKGVFKCGISVAPVSDWLLYDTLYTERFMGLPTIEDNLHGYEAASLNNKISNFRNKKYLLIHGTLDDNVHYQQSMMLAKALETNDILFQQQTYPDEGHGLTDVQPHLYHQLEHFLKECFQDPISE